MKINKVHCLFEQSGTFKKEFMKLGVPAEDYDIQNEFGETDHVVDLFAEIDKAYDGQPSLFDSIGECDLVFAFFPCTRFEAIIPLAFRGEQLQQERQTDEQKLAYSMKLHEELHGLYHGECVALGMIPMCSEDVRKRLIPVLEKLKLPVKVEIDPEKVYRAMLHDKKAQGDKITVTFVNEIGDFEMKQVYPGELKDLLYLIEKER